MGNTESQTPAGSGSAGTPSGSAGTATKSYEELVAERDSLRQSVQGLARKNQDYEERLRSLETERATPTPSASDDEELLTSSAARRLAREEAAALLQEREEAARRQYEQQAAFDAERGKWLRQAEEDFPESVKKDSPFVKKALEVYEDPTLGLSRVINGVRLPAFPNAEYTAYAKAQKLVAEATAVTTEQTATATEARAAATFASAASTAGVPAGGGSGELSDADFLKLTPEQQRAYQEDRFRVKHE